MRGEPRTRPPDRGHRLGEDAADTAATRGSAARRVGAGPADALLPKPEPLPAGHTGAQGEEQPPGHPLPAAGASRGRPGRRQRSGGTGIAPTRPARGRSAGPALIGGACRRRFGREPPDVAEICGLHERNRDTASLFAVDRRCDFPIACGCRVFYFICPAGSAATYLVGPACPNHAPAGGVAVTGPLGCNVALVAPHSRRMPYSPDSRPPPPTNVQF